MAVNRDKPDRWKDDVTESVDLYNNWFLRFAPETFRTTRVATTVDVENALKLSNNLENLQATLLQEHPAILKILRMCTCPPIAKDRLIGLSKVNPNLVRVMERDGVLPKKMGNENLRLELQKITGILVRMVDHDIFAWLESSRIPDEKEVYRASTIVADRLCTAISDPLIRNEQERRQLETLRKWLEPRGYRELPAGHGFTIKNLEPGTFCTHLNVIGLHVDDEETVNVSVDAVVMRKNGKKGALPLLTEAKSAGDFTNVNKRRKEEGTKATLLRNQYGQGIEYVLLLCGYFDTGYLGYTAAEKIDWVWEHRLDDLALWGL